MLPASAHVATHYPSRWRRPFERWLDGIDKGWALSAFLSAFVLIWTAFLIVAYQSGDLHPDVLETWSLGREFSWGNSKHPPLMGWIAGVWTTVFPPADWSFHLLAMLNSAVALSMVDLIGRRFVRGDKRLIIVLLLLLLPAYQFHAPRFNANTVLLATWPLAAYCFLRSFETRQLRWAVAAGATAALAMLGKYYSIFLIAGFVIAAAAHPQRRAYFTSLAPWISAVVGLAVLGPHLWWLVAMGATPFDYALTAHGGNSRATSIREAIYFILGVAGYLALPAFAWGLMIRLNLKDYASGLRRLDPGLLLLAWIFGATVALPPLVSVALVTDLPPLWSLQGLFLPIVIAVAATTFKVERFDTVNLAVAVLAMVSVCVVAAPFHAIYRNTNAFNMNRNFLSGAAQEITRQWREATDAPFTTITGDDNLAFATAFYSSDHRQYRPSFREPKLTSKGGWAAMCFVEDAQCTGWMDGFATLPASFIRSEFTLQTSLWGQQGLTAKIATLIVPPSSHVEPKPISGPRRERAKEFVTSEAD
jgi:4-amino-4-deoxy-L-arabinose transferase-like glycosyltransferase